MRLLRSHPNPWIIVYFLLVLYPCMQDLILAAIFMCYIINEMRYDYKLVDIIIKKLNNTYKKLKIFDK